MDKVKPPGDGIFSTRGRPLSIVCAGAFHCRVRDGNGWDHSAFITKRLDTLERYVVNLLQPDTIIA